MTGTKRKRSHPVARNATPWVKCGLSRKNWKEMMATIAFDITDLENDIGLQGPVVRGQLWEEWYTAYLIGTLKQKFWGSSCEHALMFATNTKTISDLVRPFVAGAAERARLYINPDADVEEEEMVPEATYQNRFEALRQLSDEGEALEESENEDDETAAPIEDYQTKQHDGSVDSVHSPTSQTKQKIASDQQNSPSGRTILPAKLKNKTRSTDHISTEHAPSNDGRNVDSFTQGDTKAGSSRPGRSSNSLDNIADRVIDKASCEMDLGLPANLLLQPHRQTIDDHDAEGCGLSPMKEVEYTVVKSPISKRKEGDWEKASTTLFDWPSRFSDFAAQASDAEAFCEESHEEHGGKRQKINASPTTDAAPEKSTIEDPQARDATELVDSALEPIQIFNDLLARVTERSGHIAARVAEAYTIINRNEDISPIELTSEPEGSTIANPNPDEIVNKTCILNTSQEVECTEQQPLMADTYHGSSAGQPHNDDDTKVVDGQGPNPPASRRNEPIQEHDIVAATACLRVANYLVPCTLQGFFPPIMFASSGVARQPETKFDHRFHYWAHPPAYATFLQELHDRHNITLQKRITVLKLFINGDTMCIEVGRYQGGWDWCVAMDIAAQRNCRVEVWFEVE